MAHEASFVFQTPLHFLCAPDEVHVWKKNLTLEMPEENILSPAEWARADRFKSSEQKMHFVQARHTLKKLLGQYLETDPKLIHLTHNEQGKPFLRDAASHLEFNVSHSENIALFAFSKKPVGIDIEKINFARPYLKIANRYFSEEDLRVFEALENAEEKMGYFFQWWVKKEAYAKAKGTGIWKELQGKTLDSGILMHPLHIDKDYCAALACDAQVEKVYLSDYAHFVR